MKIIIVIDLKKLKKYTIKWALKILLPVIGCASALFSKLRHVTKPSQNNAVQNNIWFLDGTEPLVFLS
jgi:hypothetical protein